MLDLIKNKEAPLSGDHAKIIRNLYNTDDGKFIADEPTSKHIHIESVVKVLENVTEAVHNSVPTEFPIVLSGDHSIAAGTIAGIKKAYPGKRLGVVWIDAHADIHTPYTTPSGNMHGMPLASVMNIDNLECKKNDVDAITVKLWEELKGVGVTNKKVNSEDLVYIGVRDVEKQEVAVIEQLGIKWFKVEDVREYGVNAIVNSVNEQLKECDLIYVSFDVDSMDPDLTSYGTGTPVKNGITPNEAKELLIEFSKNKKTACIEIVEVNPCLDEKKNKMAEVTLEIVEKIVEIIKKR